MKDNSIDFMMSYTYNGEIGEFKGKSKYDNYEFRKITCHYMQPAIWEKRLFMKILNLDIPLSIAESSLPVSITRNANCYAIKYTMSPDVSIPTLYFPHMHAIFNGQWTFIRYPQLKALVESYGIDTSTREITHGWITTYQ